MNKVVLTLTEKQSQILEKVCDAYCRLICGQPREIEELMMAAWEKRCKKETGKLMDDIWDGGWDIAQSQAKLFSDEMRMKFWGCPRSTMYGLGYDETADILYDLYQVLRHERYLNMSEKDQQQLRMTVLADKPMQFSSEPLAEIKTVIEN